MQSMCVLCHSMGITAVHQDNRLCVSVQGLNSLPEALPWLEATLIWGGVLGECHTLAALKPCIISC